MINLFGKIDQYIRKPAQVAFGEEADQPVRGKSQRLVKMAEQIMCKAIIFLHQLINDRNIDQANFGFLHSSYRIELPAGGLKGRARTKLTTFNQPDNHILILRNSYVYLCQTLNKRINMRAYISLFYNNITRLISHFVPVLINQIQLCIGQGTIKRGLIGTSFTSHNLNRTGNFNRFLAFDIDIHQYINCKFNNKFIVQILYLKKGYRAKNPLLAKGWHK